MKINKMKRLIIGLFTVSFLLGTSSCETLDLEKTQDPNFLSPDQADVNLLLNAIQLRYPNFIHTMQDAGARLVRMRDFRFRNYQNAFGGPVFLDGAWDDAYREILKDIRTMTPLAEEAQNYRSIGIAQVIEADLMITLVDFFGDVPYFEAGQGDNGVLSPVPDSGEVIYEAVLELLDQAINNFTRTDNLGNPSQDFYYNNNFENWVRLANTLKMKVYLQRRLVDPDAASSFYAIANLGNYITSTSQDFQFRWSTNAVQPDSRHPYYSTDYISQGAEIYQSNWLMEKMRSAEDPRIRYYFYRQAAVVPGQDGAAPDEQTLDCSLETPPQHYVDGGFTFCGLPDGYWGRDHGDDSGTPPDGLLRTTWGVYPVGGLFDDDAFTRINIGLGGGGAGITPIMLASWVDFMRAEMAVAVGDMGGASTFIKDGLEKSISKVQTFGDLDGGADSSFFPTEQDIADYSDAVDSDFSGGDTNSKWNILAEQFFIASFGNGIGPYNFYRRNGYPNTLQPNREPNPGGFSRSFLYPANFVNNNSNAVQKESVTEQVFWDTNSSSPGFPSSN